MILSPEIWETTPLLPQGNDQLLRELFREKGLLFRYRKNQIIFRQGDPSDFLIWVMEGNAKLVKEIGPNQTQTIDFITHTRLVAPTAVLHMESYPFSLISLSHNCLTCKVGKEDYLHLMMKNPLLVTLIMQTLNSRISGLQTRAVRMGHLNSEQRVAVTLLDMCGESNQRTSLSFRDEITPDELSRYIGITRTTLYRILKKFERSGWLKLENKELTLMDRDALNCLLQANVEL